MTDVVAGRFALCDPIARGGSGVVWRAYDRKVEQFCAAKVLRRRDAGDLLRFVHEQSVRLRHRHLLTPYSWAAEDAYVILASELVDGGSVGRLLARHGPLAEPTVTTILDQLLQALEHVHAAGLVHRDVTPANVLLRATRTGPVQTMLADFGLATGEQAPRLTRAGTVVGTPGYLPPEVFRGAAPHPRHDLYAAGQLASALVTGVEPVQIVRTETEAAPGAPLLPPGRLADTIAALTALDPNRRLDSAHSARSLLGASHAERAPRTREGLVVMVTTVLRPLTEVERDGARDGSGGAPGPGITPAGTPVTAAGHPAPTAVVALRINVPNEARRDRTDGADRSGPRRAPYDDPDGLPDDVAPRMPTSVLTGAPPRSTAVLGPPSAPPAASPPSTPPTPSGPPGRPGPPPGGPGPTPGRSRARRPKLPAFRPSHQAVLVAVSGVAAAAIVVPAVLLITRDPARPAHVQVPAMHRPSTAPVGADGRIVRAGGACSWQEQGDQITTTSGQVLLCTGSATGYRWKAR